MHPTTAIKATSLSPACLGPVDMLGLIDAEAARFY